MYSIELSKEKLFAGIKEKYGNTCTIRQLFLPISEEKLHIVEVDIGDNFYIIDKENKLSNRNNPITVPFVFFGKYYDYKEIAEALGLSLDIFFNKEAWIDF